jgi:hypothetical protein
VSAGNYIAFSTTAGKGQQQTTMRSEIFAQVPTGASIDTGADEAEVILLHNEPVVISSTVDLYSFTSVSNSDFVATINGAPSGTSVVYNAPSSGNENVIPPTGTNLAKMVLYNTTRGDSAQISSVNTGTNTITLTATVPGTWASGDTITIRSQTNTDLVTSSYFMDFAIDDTSVIPANICALDMAWNVLTDSGGAASSQLHPFDTGAASKRQTFRVMATGQVNSGELMRVAFNNRRFELNFAASGAGTLTGVVRVRGGIAKVA